MENIEKKEPYGFGGWLKFFVLTGLYLGPIIVILSLIFNFLKIEEMAPHLINLNGWTIYKYLTWFTTMLGMSYTWYCFYNLKKKFIPSSVYRMKVLLISLPIIYFILDILLMVLALGVMNQEMFIEIFFEYFKTFLKSNLILYLYLTFSKRVKNTYYP